MELRTRHKRIVFSAISAAIVFLCGMFFINKLNNVDTYAVTYEIPDGYTTFKDPNFYDCVAKSFKKEYPDEEIPDSGLTDDQLKKIRRVECSGRGLEDSEKITDVTGVEKLNAYVLSLDNNLISTFTYQGSTNVDLSNNRLTENGLDWGHKRSFGMSPPSISINFNQFTMLDIPSWWSGSINAINNNITTVRTNGVRMGNLRLSSNQITSIDLEGSSISNLQLFDNLLTTLDVTRAKYIGDLYVDDILVYTDIAYTKNGDNYIYEFDNKRGSRSFLRSSGDYGIKIENTDYYTFDEATHILTVNDPIGAGGYVQVENLAMPGYSSTDPYTTYKLALPSFSVTLDFNGGKYDNYSDIASYAIGCVVDNIDNSCTIFPGFEPVREGYVFAGWADTADAKTVAYNPGEEIKFTLNTDKTIYAVWAKEFTLIITTDNDDIHGRFDSYADRSISCRAIVNATDSCVVMIPKYEPKYNTLLGWNEDRDAVNPSYEAEDEVRLTGNMQLFPVLLKRLGISFSIVGDIQAWGEDHYEYDSQTEEWIMRKNDGWILPMPDQDHIISCYQTVPHGTCKVFLPELPVHRDVIIDGWADTYDSMNYYDYGESIFKDVTRYGAGEEVELGDSDAVRVNVNSNYEYAGRYFYPIDRSLRLDVNVDSNGGGSVPVDTYSCDLETSISTCDIVLDSNVPTRDGYKFFGYAIKSDSDIATYQPGDTMTMSSKNPATTTLYVIWNKDISIIWQEGQSHENGNGENGVVRIDYDYTKLVSVRVDDVEIVRDRDYTVTDGSTIITLLSSYLDTLANGTHTLAAFYNDGLVARTTFATSGNNQGGNTGGGTGENGGNTGGNTQGGIAVPNTGNLTEGATSSNISLAGCVFAGILLALTTLPFTIRRIKKD